METEFDRGLAHRGAPYGLALVPQPDRQEYTNPAAEAAVEQRWRPVCERHGAAILGIADVPTGRVQLELDGVPWVLERLGSGPHAVPAEVFNRWRALEAEGVPFLTWLWGEEQPQRPAFYPQPEPGVSWVGSWLGQQAARMTSWSEQLMPRLDPVVIGIIPTAPGRGLWVLIGRWFH